MQSCEIEGKEKGKEMEGRSEGKKIHFKEKERIFESRETIGRGKSSVCSE